MRWVLGFVLGAGSYVATVLTVLALPGDNPVPPYVWAPAFVVVFPVQAACIFTVKLARSGSRLTVGWSRRAVVAVVVAFEVVAATVLVVSVATTPDLPAGQPERTTEASYPTKRDGGLAYLTFAENLREEEVGQRGFVSIALVFLLVGAALIAGSIDHPRSSGRSAPAAGRAVPPAPTPYRVGGKWRRPYDNADMPQAVLWLVLGGVAAVLLVTNAASWQWWYLLVPVATAALVRRSEAGLLVSDHGVRVRTFWRTQTVPWPDLAAVTVARAGMQNADTILIKTRAGRTIRTPVRRGRWSIPWGTATPLYHSVATTRRFDAIVRLLRERVPAAMTSADELATAERPPAAVSGSLAHVAVPRPVAWCDDRRVVGTGRVDRARVEGDPADDRDDRQHG